MRRDPARPRRRLGEDERRDQIVRATIAVVAARGYDGTSMARIAEQAEVSKGLISHYFADKDDLLARTVLITVAAIRDAIAGELDLSAPVPAVIRAAIRRVATLNRTHRDELTALNQITQNLRGSDGARRFSLADYEETYRAQETLFARGQAEGSLRPFDTRIMAVTYQGALDTMLAYAEADPDADLEHHADALADILLVGITAPVPSST